MDTSEAYEHETRLHCLPAVSVYDLFHLGAKYAREVIDRVRVDETTGEALERADLAKLSTAREIIGRWVRHYHEHRLHPVLHYLPRGEYYTGCPAARLAQPRPKLTAPRTRRRELNRAASACRVTNGEDLTLTGRENSRTS